MQHYFAFLSYSHQDESEADWLQRELERFQVPASLVGKLTERGAVPRRLTPIFRDRHELAAADDLGAEIREALAHSRCLIVLCSPAAAKSKWTNAEIAAFKQLHPEGCIIAAVIAGEPLASDIPGREEEECFPPALVAKYNRRGKQTGSKIEPLAADLREGKGGRRTGFLKIVAGMLGIGLDELVRREEVRKQRRLATITAGSFVGMLAAGGLAVTAIQARDAARDQRREAESLVAFMLGDLRDKLEPIGRLDALDGVGSRVLEYYSKQDASELSDSALLQRSQALNLMAQVASSRGDLDTALRLYREAVDGTAEAVRRNPDDPQRLFDHAQNVFYVAQIARSQGDTRTSERALREYRRLATRMVALEPDDMRWRMEAQYADFNLGVALYDQQRFAEASVLFGQALQTIEALSTADPNNAEYQKQLAEALAWLADAHAAVGKIGEARLLRQRHVAFLKDIIARRGGDVDFRQRLVLGHQRLGSIHAASGEMPEAESHLRAAVRESDSLVSVEPGNNKWREHGARVRLRLAEFLLATGRRPEAASVAQQGCSIIRELIALDDTIAQRRATQRDCMIARARLALADEPGAALDLARAAVKAAKGVNSSDRIGDVRALAEANRILGDAYARTGDRASAQGAWQVGIAALSSLAGERPSETGERAELLFRIGRDGEARQLRSKLATMGVTNAGLLRA